MKTIQVMSVIGIALLLCLLFDRLEMFLMYSNDIGKTYTYTPELVRIRQSRIIQNIIVVLYAIAYIIVILRYSNRNPKT